MCVLFTVFCVLSFLSVNSDPIYQQLIKKNQTNIQEWYCKPPESGIGGAYAKISNFDWYCKYPETGIGGIGL